MLTSEQLQTATTLLPFLGDPPAALGQAFAAQATLLRFPAAATVFSEGDVCSSFTVVASGVVRVFKIGETGREITLYRFGQGESCILTASCILSARQFPAIAVVEETASAFVVPQPVFYRWIDEYQPWRTYVFDLLSGRLATVMAIVDEVAFRRMDERIATFLLQRRAPGSATLNLTHQQIAAELGTSREVVSRILADFAAGNLVSISRGAITISDATGLQRRAAAL